MKISILIATSFLLLSCSPGSEGMVSARNSDEDSLGIDNGAHTYNWITTNEDVRSIGERRAFSDVIMDFLSNQDDPSTGPTLYDSWTGIGYSWAYPDDKPSSPFQKEVISSVEKGSWSKISLVRMGVLDGIPAHADSSTVEYPWRVVAIAHTKWVDSLVFEPSEDCYKDAGRRCEFPDGQSFRFIEALTQHGGQLSPIECQVDSFYRIKVFNLIMPGKKPQPIWVYESGGASGGLYTEFGIYYGDADSDGEICMGISDNY